MTGERAGGIGNSGLDGEGGCRETGRECAGLFDADAKNGTPSSTESACEANDCVSPARALARPGSVSLAMSPPLEVKREPVPDERAECGV